MLDAVASLVVFYEGTLSARAGIEGYIRFHRPLLRILDRVAICRFDRLLADSTHVVESLNARFGTGFRCERVEGERRDEVLARIARMQRRRGHSDAAISVPQATRESQRREARAGVGRQAGLAEARRLYLEIRSTADG